MPEFKRHVFVCTNVRTPENPKGCCAARGAQEVRDAMKKKAAGLGLHGLVRVNNSGCLDACARGVAMVVYPEQIWYQGVTLGDVDEILSEHIIGGRVVSRLVMDDLAPTKDTEYVAIVPAPVASVKSK